MQPEQVRHLALAVGAPAHRCWNELGWNPGLQSVSPAFEPAVCAEHTLKRPCKFLRAAITYCMLKLHVRLGDLDDSSQELLSVVSSALPHQVAFMRAYAFRPPERVLYLFPANHACYLSHRDPLSDRPRFRLGWAVCLKPIPVTSDPG